MSQVSKKQIGICVVLLQLLLQSGVTRCADSHAANQLKQHGKPAGSSPREAHNEPTESTSVTLQAPPHAQDQDQYSASSSESPTVTSIHQVWTSSSRGSLDELSPEIIGKLRNDMPFLSAYATRPRLVGGPIANALSDSAGSVYSPPVLVEVPASPEGTGFGTKLNYRSNMNSPGADLQVSPTGSSTQRKSIVNDLGHFNEFKVETSSTSKSEHHHKKSTTLKKSPKRRRFSKAAASRSRGQSSRKKKRGRKIAKRQHSRGSKVFNSRRLVNYRPLRNGRRQQVARQSQLRVGKLRLKLDRNNLKHHMNIIRHGRYFQQQSLAKPQNQIDNNMELGTKSAGNQMTMLFSAGRGNTNEDNDDNNDGVKGGDSKTSSVNRKRPFYKKDSESAVDNELDSPEAEPEEGIVSSGDRNRTADHESEGGSKTDIDADNELDEEEQLGDGTGGEAILPSGPPKRVGDDDIEEGGDTVLVEPKSDGVDDDPDPEDFEPDDSPVEPEVVERENDERTRRVNRERPNEGGSASAAGGGIGATVGGDRAKGASGSGPDPGTGGAPDADRDDDHEDGPVGKKPGSESGVEFAGMDNIGRGSGSMGGSSAGSGGSGGSSIGGGSKKPSPAEADENLGGDDEDDDGEDGRVKVEGAKPEGGAKSIPGSVDQDSDMVDTDYRDDTDSSSRGDDRQPDITQHSTRNSTNNTNDCEDKHHHGHHDENHHHHHGDSIKWLQDAIPGEPGEDYPTASKIKVTNFSCREQKYPGYYADVETRCQVFHICQADGRQDSFLCPNGTIFNQLSSVCVWWTSVDCEALIHPGQWTEASLFEPEAAGSQLSDERHALSPPVNSPFHADHNVAIPSLYQPSDAPKYYGLNALLYKSSGGDPTSQEHQGNGSPGSSIKPKSGRRLRPVGENFEDDSVNQEAGNDGSSIDSLIRSMRRSMRRSKASDEDEASIQRKSNSVDDGEDAGMTADDLSRLRSARGPRRRRRRASSRSAPPKLTSRRVSRNSKRRKLRHGLKPKRRA